MKVILNKRFGGFDVSKACYKLYCKKKDIPCYLYSRDYSSSGHKYNKVEDEECMDICMLKDMGESFDYNPSISRRYQLRLSSENREDPILIECVEELGESASTSVSKLVVVDIPDGLKYVIDDYDGVETLHEDVPKW